MRKPLLHAATWVAVFAASSQGCGASTPEPTTSRGGPRPADTGPPFESPARWIAFPQTVGAPQATLALDDGRCLVTTDDGQRWVVTPKDKAQPCVGNGVASGSPTLEPLVGVQRVGQEFRFVAEGGAVYTSKEANGPFLRHAKAPTYLRRVTARGASIVGLDAIGSTYFYDGAAWKPATVPAGFHGIDVAADDAGRVLWLGAPESILVSTDAGHTFAEPPRGAPARIGAHQAGFSATGKLAAKGALGGLAWDESGLVPTSEPISDVHVPNVEIEAASGPRASMLLEQRATLDGMRYFEVVDGVEGARYGLARAQLGAAFEKIPLEELDACEAVKIAAAGGVLAFGCTKQIEGHASPTAELWTSKDNGTSLQLAVTLSTPSFTDLSLALSHDGTMLVSGVCKPAEPKPTEGDDKKGDGAGAEDASAICSPKAPLFVKGAVISAGVAPYLDEASARSPVLSTDGRTAYFLGRNRKDSMPAVFVSRDGGKNYQMRTIEPPQSSNWDEEDTSGGEESGYVRPLYLSESAQLTIDETGALGVVAERDAGLAWVTLDGDGRIANVGEPPEQSFMVGGVGNRVLALAYGQVDGVLRSWESLDGGATWTEVTTTPAVQRYGERGGTFLCAQGGCLLGDELARVGWEGQTEAPFAVAEDLLPGGREASLGVPITCQLVAKTEWTAIEGRQEERMTPSAYSSYSAGPALPRVRDVFRGKTAWSVLTIADDGKVDVTMGTLPDKEGGATAITKKALLGVAKSPKNGYSAVVVRQRPEGYVAMRGVVPMAKGGGFDTTKKIEGLELAWQNQYAGTFAKKTVGFETNWSTGFASTVALRPNLLVIAQQGVVAQPALGAKAVFVDASTNLPFDLPLIGGALLDGRPPGVPDATYAGGRPYAITVADRTPTAHVVVAVPSGATGRSKGGKGEASPTSGPGPQAITLAFAGSEIDRIYTHDRTGYAAFLTNTQEGPPTTAFGFLIEPDGKFGAPFELPTLADLPDRPQPCSAEDKRTTPRVASPNFGRFGAQLFDESRHAVMVSDPPASGSLLGAVPIEPMWLLTDGAILHGTKKAPCIAGWHASGARAGMVAVIGANPEQSWLVRSTAGMKAPPKGAPAKWTQQVEARPMVCRYQADLAVPYDVTTRANQRMSDDQP